MGQLIRYRYGDYTHETGEVVNFKWEEIPNYTRRARRDTAIMRATLNVELQACDQETLLDKIDALRTAYGYNDQEFVVETLGGTVLDKYSMDPNADRVLRGPYVTKILCLEGDKTELCNIRTYTIELEQFIEAPESEIIFVEESLQVIGYTGPVYVTKPVLGPAPLLLPLAGVDPLAALKTYVAWYQSPVRIVQSGRSEGFEGWYDFPAYPILAGVPGVYENVDQRVFEPGRPRKIGTSKFRYYPLRWEFNYISEVPIDAEAALSPYSPVWAW